MGRPDAGAVRQRRRAEAAGLAPTQSRTLARVARAVANARLDPADDDQRRLDAIPGVGEWTLAQLDLFGRGRYDVPLAKDVGMRNAYARVAGVRTGSVTEEEFKAVLDRYTPVSGPRRDVHRRGGMARRGARWSQSPP